MTEQEQMRAELARLRAENQQLRYTIADLQSKNRSLFQAHAELQEAFLAAAHDDSFDRPLQVHA